jgi:hypothetical protein
MKPFYRNVIVAIVASALSARAYATLPTSAFVRAEYDVSGGAGSVPDTSNGTVDDEATVATSTLPDQSIVATWASTYYSGIFATANLTNRTLGVSATSASQALYPLTGLLPGEGEGASCDIVANAYLQDNLTFTPNNPKLLGQRFNISTGWTLTGLASATASFGTVPNPGSYVPYGIIDGGSAILTVTGTGISTSGAEFGDSDQYNSMYGTQTINSGPNYGYVPVQISGIWGTPYSVNYTLALEVSSQATTTDIYSQQSASGSATAFYEHTLSWDGISTITDSNGNPITDGWTVTSDSGTDWSQPGVETPEPASLAFLSAAALAAIHRRPSRRVSLSLLSRT